MELGAPGRPFARETRLPYELLVDTAGFVVRALGTDQLPLVAFVSPAGWCCP